MAVGQKLEEARNRKGISLREVSESTKIRGDYLSAFESNNFEINLPEVYLRGFVKLYARFLDLDQEAILNDLDMELGNVRNKSSKISLGSITGSENDSEAKKSVNTSNHSRRKVQPSLKKPIFIAFGSLGGVILLIFIIYLIFDHEKDDSLNIKPQSQSNIKEVRPSLTGTTKEPNQDANKAEFTLKLAAIGPIDLLIVDDLSDGAPQDFKNISAGWEYNLKIKESFRCHCSNLENLRFSIDDGNEKKIDGEGAGNFSWQP